MADFLKDYEPVEDRLRAFWSEHPNGRVMTTLISHEDGDYIVRAEVWVGDGLDWPTASGLAHDSVDELPPNMRNSALEVCETSAIGRALANMGYAPKGKRPSREEMSKASPAAGPAVTPRTGVATKSRTGSDAGDPTSGPEAGGETAGRVPTPAQDPGPDPSPTGATGEGGPSVKSTSGSSDAEVAPEPGGTAISSGSTIYPLDPSKCSHRFPSGRWLKWDAEDRCPRCGTSRLVAIEGTTADLGSA